MNRPRRRAKAAGRVGKLDEIHVPVRNLSRMRDFYETELGFRLAFAHHDRMVALRTGGAMLVLDSTKARQGPAYLGFQVEGTAAILPRLTSVGARVLQAPSQQHWGELLTIVEDPEGNILSFEEGPAHGGHQHVHRAARARPKRKQTGT